MKKRKGQLCTQELEKPAMRASMHPDDTEAGSVGTRVTAAGALLRRHFGGWRRVSKMVIVDGILGHR